MYSAYKLNKQGDNIQPWHTPFPIWNQSVVPCPVYGGVKMNGQIIHWGGMVWGSYFLIFISALSSQRGEGFLSLFTLGQQGDQTNQSQRKSILNIRWEDWCWSWSSNSLATWCEELTHLKRPWCWERLRAGGEADDRRWDGWTASHTQWTWVWVNSRSWYWTRVLACCGSWCCKGSDTTEWLNWTELNWE